MRRLLARYGSWNLVAVGLLLLANVWAFAQPALYSPAEVLEWRKGPLIYDHSPYAPQNAGRIFWPVAAVMVDLFCLLMVAWSLYLRPRVGRLRLRYLFEGMASLGSLSLVLLAGEALTRLIIGQAFFQQYRPHPDLVWYSQPGLRDFVDKSDPVPRSTNSQGFRGREEIDEPRRPGEYRILLLGDSSTFGLGVQDGQIFADVLEVELAASSGRPVRVFNAGCPGHTSLQGLHLLTTYGPVLQPDLVLWAYNNDSCLDVAAERERVADSPTVLRLNRLLFRSDLYLLFRRVALDLVYGWKLEEYRQKYPQEQSGWVRRIPFDDYLDYLARFLEIPRSWGGSTLFIRMPVNRPLCRQIPIFATSFDDHYRDALTSFCQETGTPCIDFESSFLAPYRAELFLPQRIFHPSSLGHHEIGAGLAAYIVQQGLMSGFEKGDSGR